MDPNLSWKIHTEYIALKISKSVGLIAKLRHFVPLHTLLNICQSLISAYITYLFIYFLIIIIPYNHNTYFITYSKPISQ